MHRRSNAARLTPPAPDRSEISRDRGDGLAARAVLAALRFYQMTICQLFTGSCRFVPSCSAYAVEAVTRYGAARGVWLAARRLTRCHPLCRGGLDQVPMPDRESR